MDLIRGIEAKPRQTACKARRECDKVHVEVGLNAGKKARQVKIHSFHGNSPSTANILSPF